ncbi:hypothetical protein EUTSA_v10026713mg [Eutrema salsugineum]|uniref:Uncharacterized protein n=1 Tax=Eutrema salsugineum TaxID=72664 RepID=V4P364_EUTSA|nr:hypothetical protein EUTSA_v10026713mg [Eutrema salsugineum]
MKQLSLICLVLGMKVVKISLCVGFKSISRYLKRTSSPRRHHIPRTRPIATALCYVSRFSAITFLIHILILLKRCEFS